MKQYTRYILLALISGIVLMPSRMLYAGIFDRFRSPLKVFKNLRDDFNNDFLPKLGEHKLASAFNSSVQTYAQILPQMMNMPPDKQRMMGLNLYDIILSAEKAKHALGEGGMGARLKQKLTMGTTTFKKWYKRISKLQKRLMKDRRKGGTKRIQATKIFIHLKRFRTFVQQIQGKVVHSWGAIQRYLAQNNIPVHRLKKLKKILKKLKKKFKKLRRSKSWEEFREDLASDAYSQGYQGDKAEKKAMKRLGRIEDLKEYLDENKRTLGFEYQYYMRMLQPKMMDAQNAMNIVWNTTVKKPGFIERFRGIGNKHHVLEYIEKYHDRLSDDVDELLDEIDEIKQEADSNAEMKEVYGELVDDLEEMYDDDLKELPGKLDGKIAHSKQKRYLRQHEAMDLSARVGDLRTRINNIRLRIYHMKQASGRPMTDSSLSKDIPMGQPIMPNTAPGNMPGQFGSPHSPGMDGYEQMQQEMNSANMMQQDVQGQTSDIWNNNQNNQQQGWNQQSQQQQTWDQQPQQQAWGQQQAWS
ncbi:MAG: hypothetical protein PVJ92_01675, partial [Candidatus Dependentiae bacterium]